MGSGASTPAVPQCPEGYDPVKFKRLLRLFDAYDTDGSMSISSEDGAVVVDLAQKVVDKKVAILNKEYSAQLTYIQKEEGDKRAAFEKELQRWKTKAVADIEGIANRRERYEKMNDKQKCDVLLTDMGSKNGEAIGWSQFFAYMK